MRGPFGLEPYSTPDDDQASYLINFNYVPQPHPDLIEYRGVWRVKGGLVQISARSREFDDDASGHGSFALYRKIKRSLSERYGDPKGDELAVDADEPISAIHYDDAACISMWDFTERRGRKNGWSVSVLW